MGSQEFHYNEPHPLQAHIGIWCRYCAVLVLKSTSSYWYDYLMGFRTYGEKMELACRNYHIVKRVFMDVHRLKNPINWGEIIARTDGEDLYQTCKGGI